MYSPTDGRFLPDRYIIGVCPHCGYDRARGDQCENCTRVLEPVDLLTPRSAVSGATDLEVRDTRHLFLLQSKLQPAVQTWIDKYDTGWPLLASSIARKWLAEGLQDRAITRDLEWGIPVPADTWPDMAAEGKVFYVWFDAPLGYLAATKEWSDTHPGQDWRSWWYEADDVRYVEFMGKDNVPFHTVMFPATQLGTGEPWTMVDYIKPFSWLTYYGGKFSTSQHRGIFTDDALGLLPADYWRWWLMANAPESDDVSFTWELFAGQVNKDLADVLGNFVNRVLTFSRKRYGNAIPQGGVSGEPETRLGSRLERLLAVYREKMEGMQFRQAAATLRELWSAGNEYIDEKAPWAQVKTDRDAAALSLRTAMHLIYIYGCISAPFIPTTAETLRELWILPPESESLITWPDACHVREVDWFPAGTTFDVPDVLFTKVTDTQITELRDRFGSGER